MLFEDPRFWLAVSFFIFVGLAFKYILPVVLKMIDDKSVKITAEINAARDLKQKAEEFLEKARKYQHESILYSEKLISDAKNEAEKIIKASSSALEDEIAKKMELAIERIKLEEEKTVREIKNKIVISAIKIIEGNISKFSDGNSNKSISDKAILDISKSIH